MRGFLYDGGGKFLSSILQAKRLNLIVIVYSDPDLGRFSVPVCANECSGYTTCSIAVLHRLCSPVRSSKQRPAHSGGTSVLAFDSYELKERPSEMRLVLERKSIIWILFFAL